MKIDKNCADLILERRINFHDDSLLSFSFDRDNKRIDAEFADYSRGGAPYRVCFLNTVGFEVTSADFWGFSECIFDFELAVGENRVILPKIERRWSEIDASVALAGHKDYEDYIEVLYTFSSGDEMRIACHTIEISK